MSRFTLRLRDLIASKKFFYSLVAFITLSCIFFAASITYRIPSDEFYHLEFISFYADQSPIHSPFIANQGLDNFELRDITRTPSYLYHYVLSFPLWMVREFTSSLFAQVFVLRMLTIGIGIASLFVVRRILRQIGATSFVQNMVIGMLGLTGMLLWVFASINYDVPAIALYLLCVSVALSIVQGKGITTKRLVMFVTLAMLCVLTKVTFIPFLAILAVVTLILKRHDLRFVQNLTLKRWKHIALLALFLVTSFLFVERIGSNIIRYQQIEVSCDKVHTYQQCMQDDVFSRNENQLKVYATQKASGQGVSYQPYQFTQSWLRMMYERIHFYFGHQQMTAGPGAKAFAVIIGSFMLGLAIAFWRRIAETPGERLLLAITASYTLVMYIFNLQTYLKFGQPYAFQGRYLLPVIPFFFYFCVKLCVLMYYRLRGQWRNAFVMSVITVGLLSIYIHLPLLVFYRGTESKWWPTPLQTFNLRVQDSLHHLNIDTL